MASETPLKTMSMSTPGSPTHGSPKLAATDVPRSISPASISPSSPDHFSELSNTSNLPHLHPQALRSSKRSSSTSNDLLYERDRFRARLQNFNITKEVPHKACEVCDVIDTKTAKLGRISDEEENISPLAPESSFHKKLPSVPVFQGLHASIIVKALKPEQLAEVFEWYYSTPLVETQEMFPWLHGLHPNNFAQRQFFIQQQLSYLEPSNTDSVNPIDTKPSCRFLMCVKADVSHKSDLVLRNNTAIDEILTPIEVSRLEVKSIVEQIVSKVFNGETPEFLSRASKVFLDDVQGVKFLPIFLNLDPDRGVSLRNFHIQVTKASICSDIIVYCLNKQNVDACYSMARLIWLAQQFERTNNQSYPNGLIYNVFVATELIPETLDGFITSPTMNLPFLSKNFDLNKAIKCPCKLLNAWDGEYVLKEKIETLKMSSATRMIGKFYSGNAWDYQSFVNAKYANTEEYESNYNPDKIGHAYCDPKNSIVTANYNPDNLIETVLQEPNLKYRLFVNCFNEASFPGSESLRNLLQESSKEVEIGDYYCLNFPPSGSVGLGDCKKDNILSIINTCKLMYLFSVKLGLDTLVYCSDGYTEASLLNLLFIVYATDCAVSDAIIDLHVKYGRPFYIFNTDVVILNNIEPFLRKLSPASNSAIQWDQLEVLSNQEINEILLNPRLTTSPRLKVGYMERINEYEDDNSSDASSTSSEFSILEYDWCKEVEGSIPSKILPYMYLGSLKHANCVPLLNKLGITKIISVGEPLDWINGTTFQNENNISVQELSGGAIEIFSIKPKLGMQNRLPNSVDQIMKVNNLQDDGIDQLESSLPIILKFIDDEHKRSNGRTKFLVHCRVGVSRSATVVIAQVMKQLKINLPKAYLYVRVRRLNIIIQPNLKFMYELFKWEERKRGNSEPGRHQLREIDWFAMCREITLLNNPYLGN